MRSTVIACLVTLASACASMDSDFILGPEVALGGPEAPDLVEVQPGVQVIVDYDYPVFFSTGSYWRYDNGVWFRSTRYYDDWTYDGPPPRAIAQITKPYAYTHYQPNHHYKVHGRPMRQRQRTINPPRPNNHYTY